MPTFNRPFLALLALGIAVAAWAAGLIKVQSDQGILELAIGPRRRVALTFDWRDGWLLLILAVGVGWAMAAALQKSSWVPGSERLVPGLAVATLAGWLLATSGLSLRMSSVVGTISMLAYIVWATIDAVRLPAVSPLAVPVVEALVRWARALVFQAQFGPLVGLLALVMWTGWWTSWWVFRRRAGLVALLPSGTILTVEIFNDPNPGLYFFTLTWLACGILLLLRLNYVALKGRWRTHRLPRAADTGWTFGEVGFEATALLLVVAFLLPPLSTQDVSSFLFPGSARTDQVLHPFHFGGPSRGPSGDIGYSETVRPGSQLRAKPIPIMSVTQSGGTGSIGLYPFWRGVALGAWDGIQWTPLLNTSGPFMRAEIRLDPKDSVPRDDLPSDPRNLSFAQFTFHVVGKPEQTLSTTFAPGEIIWVDKHPISVRGTVSSLSSTAGTGGPSNAGGGRPRFDIVDRVRFADNPHQPYDYTVDVAIPTADEKSLREASTLYPAWVQLYTQLYAGGRRAAGYSTDKDRAIAALAEKIVADAHAANPYDKAKAIEQWFRDKDRFNYTLTPPQAPPGVRPLDYFLFESKKGYCQDFSTAMGVMLRSLHVPVRQMSGFGLGGLDERSQRYQVQATGAHSWVEVYFPGYGWIPFEPTPDDVNFPVNRPTTADELGAAGAGSSEGAGHDQTQAQVPEDLEDAGGGGAYSGINAVWSRFWPVVAGILLALLIALVAIVRWLYGARDLPKMWGRLRFLGDRLEVPRSPGDTPTEYGSRLAAAAPEIQREVRTLARLYTRARFRRGGLEPPAVGEVHGAWRRIRRRYPSLVAGAWRERVRGSRVSGAGAAGSGSREPRSRH